jgi:hypothetical protein
MISGKNLGNTLRYDSGSDSGEVPSSDSGKESGIISAKNPGEHLGKKLGKEVGQDKNMQDKVFASGKRPFCTQEHQVYTRPIEQGDEVESESNKKGQSKLKEEI